MSPWWVIPDAPWRTRLAALMFPGCEAARNEKVDWDRLAYIVETHRLGPWLHQRGVDAPEASREQWSEAANVAALRALQMQQNLLNLLDLLEPHGIEPVALKGVPLSLFAYDQPWHRPMRDIDLLIADRAATLDAWKTMLAAGYSPYQDQIGDAEAILDERHQLPPILSPNAQTVIELHQRTGHGRGPEVPMTSQYRSFLGRDARFPTPEALVVHLVRHAARDHRFDNGPQVLVDIAKVFETERVDGAVLREATSSERLERHMALLFAMAADAFPETKIASPFDIDVTTDARSLAWTLMTSDPDDLAQARDRATTIKAGFGHVSRRLFPSPRRLAAAQGKGNPLKQYVAHYRRLLTERLPTLAGSGRQDERLAKLVDWLGD